MKEIMGFPAVDQGQVPRGGHGIGVLSGRERALIRFRRFIAEKPPSDDYSNFWPAGLHRALAGLCGSLLKKDGVALNVALQRLRQRRRRAGHVSLRFTSKISIYLYEFAPFVFARLCGQ
jgi:hypothetical protein